MKYFFILLVGLVSLNAHANLVVDTTIVEFTDKQMNKRITIQTASDKHISLPISLNLNEILTNLGIDSNDREKTLVLISSGKAEKDTVLLINRDGQKISIIAKEPKSKKPALEWSGKWPEEQTEEQEKDYVYQDEQDPKQELPDKPKRFFSKSDFGFYFGLNTFVNDQAAAPDQMYDLRSWQSKYIALSFRKNATFLNTENMDVALSFGPEIAWHNFMFKNSNTAYYRNSQVSFANADFSTQKSKLVLPYLNLPVLINIGTKKEKLKFGLGAYLGYRIGGYTKTKDLDGDKVKNKNSFGMNDMIYGLTAEMGKKNGFTLFVRYNLNDTFKSNQLNANDLKALSFGIRI